MITNLISFLYDIDVDYIRKNNDSYVFYYNNSFYIFKQTTLDEKYIAYLSNFLLDKGMFHSLIKNRYYTYLSKFNNEYYVLMKAKFNVNRMLLLNDFFDNAFIVSYISRDNFMWLKLWKNKIDQVVTYINNNYLDIVSLSIINYYLELGEIAIDYFNSNVKNDVFAITCCHKRIKKDFNLYEYYSIVDIVFDHQFRDVAEYVKCDIYIDREIDLNKYKVLRNIKDKELLISRLLFPSYFFDVVDDFIINQREFKTFFEYFINMDIFEKNLIKIIDFIAK